MAQPRVIVIGAGPAGVRAAQTLLAAGVRPTVIDEGSMAGGQIYRRQPPGFTRSYDTLYGPEADKARAVHRDFDALAGRVDYRPETLAWALRENTLHVMHGGVAEALEFDALILATGATDRLIPMRGWTLPGCFSLGGAQIALKAQGCAIGARPVFMGTGPLLYLVAYQYLKAGAKPVAVLDTSPAAAQRAAFPRLLARPALALRGAAMRLRLQLAGVRIENGVEPVAIEGDEGVAGVRYRKVRGGEEALSCDAVGLGYHLRSETQLADLAECEFVFDETIAQWKPWTDADGRSSRPDVVIAGDGARVLGADAAEAAGRLAALAVLADCGLQDTAAERARLRKVLGRMERFRQGLAQAFPWPAHLARAVEDDVVVCRCEEITAGTMRAVSQEKGAPELNRAKALSRVGMGRCQGRYCGHAAAEILAGSRGCPLKDVGRLRGQAPVKPLSLATVGAQAQPD
ncbi:MAG: NAD(P)/FAD-dependent oxidoreductase [Novosphingobium sp.]|uniref:FAD/NAD(P)-dependent oxidoreductase n=1 Tax=Novosphingobium sp. TaxID=1874826 RepID=UPI0012C972C9|nr:FAD/NAD(P)-binding oxidoreductase [Novosphingobium sp.]MPS68859.1 NAD(P)/FAD-dependent oxidoreductase [Novosphingobium sp.]